MVSDMDLDNCSPGAFEERFRGALLEFLDRNRTRSWQQLKKRSHVPGSATFVFPVVQMGPLGISQDDQLLEQILSTASPAAHITIATVYFNMNDHHRRWVRKSPAAVDVLVPSEKANGFYGAAGMSRHVPSMYTSVMCSFLDEIGSTKEVRHRIRLLEYERDGWSFHAKGMWYAESMNQAPCMTLIGSPNYGLKHTRATSVVWF